MCDDALLSNSVDRSITICSDSQAVLKSISTAKTTSGLVWETMTKLRSLSVHNCVWLLWTLGHSNIEGNEIAGSLPKHAAITDFTGPEPVPGLSIMSVRNTVHHWSVQEQIKRWNSIQSCWQVRQLVQDNSILFAKYAVRLLRKDLKILVGLQYRVVKTIRFF